MTNIIKLLVIITSFFFVGQGIAQDKGIKFFEGTWEEALAESKKQNKPIFLDAYASWCGPCKMMAKNTFTKEKAGTYFNEHFINVKMDMEKGEGVMMSKQLQITAYPTLFFINSEGRILAKSIGYHTARALVDVGEQVSQLTKEAAE